MIKKYKYLGITLVLAIYCGWFLPVRAFTFAVIGDTQNFSSSGTGGFQQAAAQIRKANPELVLSMGDLLHSCDGSNFCVSRYNQWKGIMGSLMDRTYAAVGNHDRTGGGKAVKVWRKVFNFPTNGPTDYSKETYSFDYGDSHFVALDSEKPTHTINYVQRQWLENDLDKNTKKNIFVFWHEPAFHTSFEKTDNLELHPTERDALWKILDKHKVTAVFNGHEHLFSEKIINSKVFSGATHSIPQFVVGHTDVSAPDASDPGHASYYYYGESFALVNVSENLIILKLYTVGAKLVKTFTIPIQ